jgi:ethanolamine ammonia-lyase small subunit
MSLPRDIALDPWHALREHTAARVALGRAGSSLPTREVLAFGCDHALARDAVHRPLEADTLAEQIAAAGWPVHRVHSAAPDRATYLLRPDLGRRLDEASAARLAEVAAGAIRPPVVWVVADGLSSLATSRHALPLLEAARRIGPPAWAGAPVVVAEQARVALGDPVGELLGAALAVVLIGERPGLSSPDSLGIYLTWAPRRGRVDAERNCISNVRPEGQPVAEAARRLVWLATEARRLQLSGVQLTDLSGPAAALPG